MSRITLNKYKNNRFDEIARREKNLERRAFLDLVDLQWYIETDFTVDGNAQGGDVIEIIRDKYGIPVCFKVENSNGERDWIEANRVTFFEPYDCWVDNVEDYRTAAEWEKLMAGYFGKGEDGEWHDPQTGEVVGY